MNKVGRKLLGVKFRGTFPSDKIPKLNNLTPYCILNLDRSDQPGSHWVAVAKNPEKSEVVVYDSFGRTYRKIIPNLSSSGNGRVIDTDKDQEQKIKQTDCGARCMAFLLFVDKYGYRDSLKI